MQRERERECEGTCCAVPERMKLKKRSEREIETEKETGKAINNRFIHLRVIHRFELNVCVYYGGMGPGI